MRTRVVTDPGSPEVGATGSPVANALARLTGVRLRDLPLTPERVWRALRARKDPETHAGEPS